MLRVHFTVADAARVRVVVLGPLAELELSFEALRLGARRPLFDGWRRPAVAAAATLPPDVRQVARVLVPPSAPMVDLFTLVGSAGDLDEGLARLFDAPAGALDAEFSYSMSAAGVRPGWVAEVARGDVAARRRMAAALTDYHAVAVEPYWPGMRAVLENERTARLDLAASHGLDAMLTSLTPRIRWRPPLLEVPSGMSGDKDIHLDGRGLLLAPSLFALETRLWMPEDDSPPMLIYPAALEAPAALSAWRRPEDTGDRALAGLLGPTRAAALRMIAGGVTTTELARRLGISPGGASQHATILREAGLAVSVRHRNTVRHSLTALGVALLNAG